MKNKNVNQHDYKLSLRVEMSHLIFILSQIYPFGKVYIPKTDLSNVDEIRLVGNLVRLIWVKVVAIECMNLKKYLTDYYFSAKSN